jgi:hypothetical protein
MAIGFAGFFASAKQADIGLKYQLWAAAYTFIAEPNINPVVDAAMPLLILISFTVTGAPLGDLMSYPGDGWK